MATAKEETRAPEPGVEEVVNTVVDEAAALGVRRYFTIPGRDPFDEIEWEIRDAFIPGKDKPAFEQKGVEFPKFWSQTATNIVAQKYFRGRLSSPERESSVKQMLGRVVGTIGAWGREGGYFATEEEAETFEAELKAILVNQRASSSRPAGTCPSTRRTGRRSSTRTRTTPSGSATPSWRPSSRARSGT